MLYQKCFLEFFSEFLYGCWMGMFFSLKPSAQCTYRGMFPEMLSLIDAAVLEELRNKQTKTQTHCHPIALEEGFHIISFLNISSRDTFKSSKKTSPVVLVSSNLVES